MENDLMERARAAVCYINTGNRSSESEKRTEYFAYLSLFHPDIPLEKRLRMAWDMAKDDR